MTSQLELELVLKQLADIGERFLYLRPEYEETGKIKTGEFTNVHYSALWIIYDYVHQGESEDETIQSEQAGNVQ